MQKLPVGISSFEKIREEDYLYVDKTKWIHQLVDHGMYYFLSRPRRFGKSLLMSTLRCLFEGRRELFKGLWIEDQWDWDKKYPVLMIDFNKISHSTPSILEEDIKKHLYEQGISFSINLEKRTSLKNLFHNLILKLVEKHGQDVVFLIDEYDKPIISHLGRGEEHIEIAKENREVLKEFYGVIKAAEVARVTKFVLLTGVSKFSKVGVFSELNNLLDITMNENYVEIMGITEEEIEKYLLPAKTELAKKQKISLKTIDEKLKSYYNGYRFSNNEKTLYNPFSLLCCFQEGEFKNYWFQSGTPTFLVNLIKEKEYYLPKMEGVELRENDFSTYDLERLKINALLFQTGYITIKGKEDDIYCLGYPNLEVKESFVSVLFCEYLQKEETAVFTRIAKSLAAGNLEVFIDLIKGLFAGISYPLSCKQNEAYFHSLFYLMVSGSGVFTETEVLTSEGRIDLVVYLKDKIYLMEFKCDQSSQKAIDQIREKKYPQKYQNLNKPIHIVGINFSQETRNITDWQSA